MTPARDAWLRTLVVMAVVVAVVLMVSSSVALAEEIVPEEPEVAEPGAPPGATFKVILSYGLALLGLGLVLSVVAKTAAAHIRYPATRLQVTNLLRSQPRRAEAMCKNTPESFLEGIGAALKAGAMTGTRDPAVITATTVPSYDAMGTLVQSRWKMALGRAKMGGLAVAGGLGVSASSGNFPIPIILIGVVGIGCFVWLLVFKHEVETSIVRARREILPEVDRVFIDGRYG